MKKQRLLSVLTALVMVTGLTVPAIADTLETIDADTLAVLNGVNINLGIVKYGVPVTPQSIKLAIQRSGKQTDKIVKDDSTVSITASPEYGSGLIANGGSIYFKQGWGSSPINSTLSDTITSTINLAVPQGLADNQYNKVINYAASGTSQSSSYSYSTKINVHYTVDNTAPVISLPTVPPTEATGPDGAIVNFNVTANDGNFGSEPVVCTPASGSKFKIGTTIVSCYTKDQLGNEVTKYFDVVVQDITAPVLPTITDTEVQATSKDGAVVTYSAKATDIVDGDVDVTFSPASGSTLPVGITTVSYTATDKTGNTAAAKSFTVTVDEYVPADTTPPVLTLPKDIVIEATGPNGAAVTFNATASDNVDGSVPVICSNSSGSTFTLGDTTVNCSATDAAGNTVNGSFKITVQDTTAPTITTPAAVAVKTIGKLTTVDLGNATTSDLVSSGADLKITNNAPASFPVGTTIVTWTATDKAGNSNTATQKVTVTYNYSGVLQPINRENNSQFKLGSTVPVKFILTTANGGPVDFATASISVKQGLVASSSTVVEDTCTLAASTGSTFKYDLTSNQYIYNLSTKSYTTGWYTIIITLDDGTVSTVAINLK
jgi:hypothetical protein